MIKEWKVFFFVLTTSNNCTHTHTHTHTQHPHHKLFCLFGWGVCGGVWGCVFACLCSFQQIHTLFDKGSGLCWDSFWLFLAVLLVNRRRKNRQKPQLLYEEKSIRHHFFNYMREQLFSLSYTTFSFFLSFLLLCFRERERECFYCCCFHNNKQTHTHPQKNIEKQ